MQPKIEYGEDWSQLSEEGTWKHPPPTPSGLMDPENGWAEEFISLQSNSWTTYFAILPSDFYTTYCIHFLDHSNYTCVYCYIWDQQTNLGWFKVFFQWGQLVIFVIDWSTVWEVHLYLAGACTRRSPEWLIELCLVHELLFLLTLCSDPNLSFRFIHLWIKAHPKMLS